MNEAVLTFEQVSKRFGFHEVLKNVTFPLKKGECAALTGMNGSGKTTLLKLAAGLTLPSSGTVRAKEKIRIQYIPESFPRLNLSARSLLRSLGGVEGLDKKRMKGRTDQLLELFNLQDSSGTPLRAYSKGMLQKVSVIQAFLSRADVLLLDEPLSGQDRESQDAFIHLARECLLEGTAVLLACHERSLIRALAGTAYRIREGELRACEVPMEEAEVICLFETPEEGFLIPPDLDGILRIENPGRELLAAVSPGACDGILMRMLQAGCKLKEMRREKDR